MTSEPPETGFLAQTPSLVRPWAGVVFSLILPGFGLARACRFRRALAWFLDLELGLLLVGVCFALAAIPFWVPVAAVGVWLLAFLAMLYDSYRPGRMTAKYWAAFVGLCLLDLVAGGANDLVVHPFKIATEPMSPTLQGPAGHGDHFFVDRLTYRFSSPRRGDLLVFRTAGIEGLPEHQIWVKRLVGLPGETIEIKSGGVFANGVRLTQKDGIPPLCYVPGPPIGPGGTTTLPSYRVPPQSFFVLGDNSTNSLDSRYFGSVPRSNVYGRVGAIYYPFSRAGRPR